MTIAREDFEREEIRVGTIVDAVEFPRARKPPILVTPTQDAPDGGRLF